MARLEALRAGAFIGGLAPNGAAKVVHVEWFGDQVVKVTYEDAAGAVGDRLVYRNEEAALDAVEAGLPWSFDGDGALLRLVSEAWRIRLAHLFDPYLAISAARVEPLPHQITAVYGEMLARQPLRFLLSPDRAHECRDRKAPARPRRPCPVSWMRGKGDRRRRGSPP